MNTRRIAKTVKRQTACIAAVLGVVLCCPHAWAEENGSGSYTPGSIASPLDSMLPAPGWIIRPNYYNFSGEHNIACVEATCDDRAKVKATYSAVSLTAGWRPEIDLGSRYSYMMSISVPYVFADVRATVTSNSTGTSSHLTGTNEGLGDIELIPLNLSYHVDDISNVNFKFITRAPTGKYNANQLAIIGKNYWSFEPTVSYLYYDKETGLDGTIYTGINFNTTNTDTDFHSGSQAHIEYTLQKKFLYGNGQIGVGLTGYNYQQIADDSGSGAVFRNERASVSGIGPIMSYATQLWGQTYVSELKWVHDYEVKNRFGGDTVLLKAGLLF